MSYRIDFWPRDNIPGVKRRTVIVATAMSALCLVQMLEACREQTETRHPAGHVISLSQLKILAETEEVEAFNKRRK